MILAIDPVIPHIDVPDNPVIPHVVPIMPHVQAQPTIQVTVTYDPTTAHATPLPSWVHVGLVCALVIAIVVLFLMSMGKWDR